MKPKKQTNYQRGYLIERELVNRAREKGEVAYRSAGSHSPIDVTRIDTRNRIIRVIQCKRVKRGEHKREVRLIPAGFYEVIPQLYIHRDRRDPVLIDLR